MKAARNYLRTLGLLIGLGLLEVTHGEEESAADRRMARGEVRGLLQDACRYYELLRSEEGFYHDLLRLDGRKMSNRASTASTGMGLIALCIAHEMKFDDDAESKALQTIKAIDRIGRNPNGFREHWFDTHNGERIGKGEFSTIDTSLMMAGAVFCRNTFPDNAEIEGETRKLWNSIQWETAKVDELRYELNQDANGHGGIQKTRLFSEYLLLADYCSLAAGEPPFSNWGHLKRMDYKDRSALAMNPKHSLPLFTFQFPLYLSPIRTSDPVYRKECVAAARMDRLWWSDQLEGKTGIWGSSAGASPGGYGVDSTALNPNLIATAPAVIGFIPFEPQFEKDFLAMKSELPGLLVEHEGMKLYWRTSLKMPDWNPRAIQGIDFCPMLFGLAAHPHALGFEFFQQRSQLGMD